jgi:hypothetical protein
MDYIKEYLNFPISPRPIELPRCVKFGNLLKFSRLTEEKMARIRERFHQPFVETFNKIGDYWDSHDDNGMQRSPEQHQLTDHILFELQQLELCTQRLGEYLLGESLDFPSWEDRLENSDNHLEFSEEIPF